MLQLAGVLWMQRTSKEALFQYLRGHFQARKNSDQYIIFQFITHFKTEVFGYLFLIVRLFSFSLIYFFFFINIFLSIF